MKIGIDAFGCGHGRSGFGAYLASLCAHFPEDENFTVELFGPELDRYTYTAGSRAAYEGVPVPDNPAAERLWHLFCAPAFIKKRRYGCVLFPAGLFLRAYPFPAVAVVHDVLSRRLGPGGAGRSLRSLRRVPRVIASTQFVKKALAALGIPAAKIDVVYNGIDHALFRPMPAGEGADEGGGPFAVKRPYFIYPSRILGPEKKHVELIRAFTLFKMDTGLPHRLVLAGAGGPGVGAAREAIAKSPFAHDIFLTGHFPHSAIARLYAGADACVFPASGEGTALPVIEAMAVGIPCACAKSGALPEIAGPHAVFFDAGNTVDIALALHAVAADSALRAALTAGGLEWTKRFTWEKTVRRTLDSIEAAVRAFPR